MSDETDTPTPSTSVALSPERERAMIERQAALSLVVFDKNNGPFSSANHFAQAMKIANSICNSEMIPDSYRGKPDNILVAFDYGARLGLGILQTLQTLYVVKGKPSLAGSAMAAVVNTCGLFSRLKHEWRGTIGPDGTPSDDYGCRAYATELATGERIDGTWIDWSMVKGEKWDKNEKWTTMRDQMFIYRADSFWGRANASDVTLGMHTKEELDDMEVIDGTFTNVTTGKVGGGTAKNRLQERLDRAEREAGDGGGANGPGYTPVDMSAKEPGYGDGLSTVQVADAGDKVPDPDKPTGRKPRVRKAVEPVVQDSDDNADGTPNTDELKPTPEPEAKPATDNTAFDLE